MIHEVWRVRKNTWADSPCHSILQNTTLDPIDTAWERNCSKHPLRRSGSDAFNCSMNGTRLPFCFRSRLRVFFFKWLFRGGVFFMVFPINSTPKSFKSRLVSPRRPLIQIRVVILLTITSGPGATRLAPSPVKCCHGGWGWSGGASSAQKALEISVRPWIMEINSKNQP